MRKMILLMVLAAAGLGAASWSSEQVRNDFAAGFAGDEAALARGMKACEAALAGNPKHAEARVWHGVGLYFQAGQAFQSGDQQKAFPLVELGLADMDAAVELAPDDPAVRIPRGIALLESVRAMGDTPIVPSLLANAASDFEKAIEVIGPGLSSWSAEDRGQILFSLADTYSRQGKEAEARQYFERVANEAAGTTWARQASSRLAK